MSKKITKTFKTEELREMEMPHEPPEGGRIVSSEIVREARWYEERWLVVQFPEQMGTDEAWRFLYYTGSTECQEQDSWNDADEVVATLVHKTEKVVEVWE